MDAETQQKIFGIFERARGSARFAGTGIGLAIVAKAVQRMGGGGMALSLDWGRAAGSG